jgi:hypothetical protein
MGNDSVDTGANYAKRLSTNGGADTTAVSDSGCLMILTVAGNYSRIFSWLYIKFIR